MSVEVEPPRWRRELPEYVSVSLEGAFTGIEADITDRTPGRVIIVMPDFTADVLAHVLARLNRVAEALGQERVGVGEMELAEALFAAAQAAGYRCVSASLLDEAV